MRISRASLQCKSGLIVWIKVFHAKEEMVSFLTASIDFRHASHIGLGFWGFFWGHQHKYTMDFAMFFPTSIPAVFLEKIANWPQEICHSLAGTASGEEAVRAAGTRDASRQLCRTAPLPQGELLFLQIPPSQPWAKSCSDTALCLLELTLSYRIKWWTVGVGEQACSHHTVITLELTETVTTFQS